MVQERIHETVDASGNISERSVVREGGPAHVTINTEPAPPRGGSGIIFIALFALALIIGYLLFDNGGEARKDNAVAEAANDVGAAAEKAGNAVEKAADRINK